MKVMLRNIIAVGLQDLKCRFNLLLCKTLLQISDEPAEIFRVISPVHFVKLQSLLSGIIQDLLFIIPLAPPVEES